MGIPRLLHHLEPYATPVVFEKDKPEEAREAGVTTTKLIIDGPGLAYYAYHQTLSRRSQARNALEAMPTYQEVNSFVVKLLARLEDCGLDIAAILFDGFLPPSKRPTRAQRLNASLTQLTHFRAAHPSGPLYSPQEVFVYSDLFAARPLPTGLRALPALPFLVPAVLEALRASPFADATCVVPGEADAFCASLAAAGGGIVLSGDSDLLVHELGQGCVMLFRDLELGERGRLRAAVYQPADIASAVGLKSLVPLGFVLAEDCHRSMLECVRLAKEVGKGTPGYEAFCVEYRALGLENSAIRHLVSPSDAETTLEQDIVDQHLRALDPRISEYVHQVWPSIGTSAPPPPSTTNPGEAEAETETEPEPTPMYLPLLLSDPSRASAWRPSTALRQLAYSILALASSSSSSPKTPQTQTQSKTQTQRKTLTGIETQTHEHHPKGPRIAPTPIAHLTREQTTAAAADLVATIRDVRESCANVPSLSAITLWRLTALTLLHKTLRANGERLPQRQDALDVLGGGRTGVLPWDFVHYGAQVEAVLYSLRILKQVVGLALTGRWERTRGQDSESLAEKLEELKVFAELEFLRAALGGLPRVAGVVDGVAVVVEGDGAIWGRCVDGLLGFGRVEGEGRGRKRRKVKREGKRGGDDGGEEEDSNKGKNKSNNMYSLLLDES